MAGRGRVEGHLQVGRAVRASEEDAPLGSLLWLLEAHGRHLRSGRQAAEVPPHLLQHLLGLEVPHHHGHAVARGVEGAVVVVEVVPGHGEEVALPADDRVVVAVGLEGGRVHLHAQEPGVVVLAALPLADDDRPLRLHLLRVEDGVDHAVALHLQSQLDAIHREGLEVGGPVPPGHAVEEAAGPGHHLVELALGELFRALEEHVLHPVADARAAGQLVAAAHPVVDPEAGHRGHVAFLDDHLEAVLQLGSQQVLRAGRLGAGVSDHCCFLGLRPGR